ncbi:MAG: hypothetical protein SRB2_00420 [Desulfobacteraceae bacterium Eth-SRB2]|nr:MAG: hypothetical protein SRB2_00420 [Desulfobacteraceae bacterium Eth-SRB2]
MAKNIFLVFLTVILCFFVGELTIRFIDPPYFKNPYRKYDSELGWTNRKECSSYNIQGDKKPWLLEFNKEGFRGVNYPVIKPRNTRRVIILGDSLSEATQVNLEDIYWRKLNHLLEKSSSLYRWEVINFGAGDYGTTQEYLALVGRALKYAPDLIVLQVFPLNDICNNSITAAKIASPQDEYRPYFDPKTQYRTITYTSPTTAWLRRHLVLFRFFDVRIRHLTSKISGKPYAGSSDSWLSHIQSKLTEFGLPTVSLYDSPLYSALASILLNTFAEPKYQLPFIRDGWEATDHAIKQIYVIAEKARIPIIVLVFPGELELSPKYAKWRNRFPFPVNRHYPGQRIAAVLRPYNVPLLTFIDTFEECPDKVIPYIDGHFNAAAHEIVANLLVNVIRNVLPEVPDYQWGKIFTFDGRGMGQGSLTYGIAKPAMDISWTIAEKAGIHLQLPQTEKQLIMKLRAVPFAPEKLGTNQSVNIYFNGKKIACWSLFGKSMTTYQALIAPSLIAADKPSEIMFEFSERQSPNTLGISPDARLLGLALFDLVIDEVPK